MIYLDNASTTKIYDEVNKKIFEINSEQYFNPSALYQQAIDTSNLLRQSREKLASCLGTTEDHILFTSGATEGNNLAINGFLTGKKDAEYIFDMGEHPSIFNVAKNLTSKDKIVKFINLTSEGVVDENELKNALSSNTHFVSIMHVSNETGAINDIKKLCKMIKDYNSNIIVHCDGTQAFGKIPVNVTDLGVDCYTISAHKFHGPKGVGAIYVKNMDKLKPLFYGGGQQKEKRSGTENVSGIVGMCLAGELATKELKENFDRICEYRNYMIEQISNGCENFVINQAKNNSPYILSISFKGLRGEVLLHLLEKQGILVGTGSACSSKKQNNRILENMSVKKEYILGSIRISFSSFNNFEEVKLATEQIIKQYKNLKESMSK